MEMITFLPLLWMIRSDFKERTVGLVVLVLFGVMVTITEGIGGGWQVCLFRFLQNMMLLGFLVIGVMTYFILKDKRSVLAGQSVGGMGDIGFLVCLTPAFEVLDFTWFLVVSSFLSLLFYPFIPSWRQKGIPFVSTLGISYIVYVLYHLFTEL